MRVGFTSPGPLVTESRLVFGGVGVLLFVCLLGLVVAVWFVCFVVVGRWLAVSGFASAFSK